MSRLVCPNCSLPLSISDDGKVYSCPSRHSFDVSAAGYVNLTLNRTSSQKRHGDDKLMVLSRNEFLSAGYYKPLLDALCAAAGKYAPADGSVSLLDCGCGEGYYTVGLYDYFAVAGKKPEFYGTDISKEALIGAFRRGRGQTRNITYAVASNSHLPLGDGAVDIVTDVFAPHDEAEFARVLKVGGVFIRAIPLERHLYELKTIIYDEPYENVPDLPDFSDFTQVYRENIKYKFTVEGAQIENLFKMTPYYYKTSVTDQKKLDGVEKLTVSAEFAVVAYTKNKDI